MNCAECQGLIQSYVGDELEGELGTEIESHLASCRDCGCEAANWQACLASLRRTFADQTPPETLLEKIRAETEQLV